MLAKRIAMIKPSWPCYLSFCANGFYFLFLLENGQTKTSVIIMIFQKRHSHGKKTASNKDNCFLGLKRITHSRRKWAPHADIKKGFVKFRSKHLICPRFSPQGCFHQVIMFSQRDSCAIFIPTGISFCPILYFSVFSLWRRASVGTTQIPSCSTTFRSDPGGGRSAWILGPSVSLGINLGTERLFDRWRPILYNILFLFPRWNYKFLLKVLFSARFRFLLLHFYYCSTTFRSGGGALEY